MGTIVLFGLVLFTLMHSVNGVISEHKRVHTHDGIVRGQLKQTLFRNVSYYEFLGIPYAQKPVGDLRFKVCTSFNFRRATFLNDK